MAGLWCAWPHSGREGAGVEEGTYLSTPSPHNFYALYPVVCFAQDYLGRSTNQFFKSFIFQHSNGTCVPSASPSQAFESPTCVWRSASPLREFFGSTLIWLPLSMSQDDVQYAETYNALRKHVLSWQHQAIMVQDCQTFKLHNCWQHLLTCPFLPGALYPQVC